MSRWVIMNIKQKMNIHQAIEWFDSEQITIIKARRYSYRGANEVIYIIGAYGNYGANKGDTVEYITDTGNGYGGKGKLFVEDVLSSGTRWNNKIMSSQNLMELNEVEKLPIWVFK